MWGSVQKLYNLNFRGPLGRQGHINLKKRREQASPDIVTDTILKISLKVTFQSTAEFEKLLGRHHSHIILGSISEGHRLLVTKRAANMQELPASMRILY
jgi:hypothetical protein